MPLWNCHWFISESKNKRLYMKLRLTDPVLGSCMFSNMPGITSYFQWQQSGLQGRENPWHALSCKLSFKYYVLTEANGHCEKREWWMKNRGEKRQVWWPPMSVWSRRPGGCVCVCVLCAKICEKCLFGERWLEMLFDDRTDFSHFMFLSSHLTYKYSCNPMQLWDNTTNLFSALNLLASLARPGLKWAAWKEQRA